MPPPAAEAAPRPAPLLRLHDEGPEVRALQEQLVARGLDPGPVDGRFGPATLQGVYTLQALHGLRLDGVVGPLTRTALATSLPPEVLLPELGEKRVVVDLDRQLLFGYRRGVPVVVTHVATGAPATPTPRGRYTLLRVIRGWRESPCGLVYNPLFFRGGLAVHGARQVPPYPASHGCVRVPLHIAEQLPALFDVGDPVAVIGG